MGPAGGSDQYVAGLQITMNHAAQMGGVHGIADGCEGAERIPQRAPRPGLISPAGGHIAIERNAVDQVHHEELGSIRDAGVMDRDDVGMAEADENLDLAAESQSIRGAREGPAIEYLDR